MFANIGFFELLVVFSGGYALFRLKQRIGEGEVEQARLIERAGDLERRLFKTEKDLEAVRQLATKGTGTSASVELVTPVSEKPKPQAPSEKLLTALATSAPPPIPAGAIPALGTDHASSLPAR